MALVGTVPVRFNNRAAVTITSFSESLDRPGQVKSGGYGPIDSSQGIETGTGSFKVAIRQETGPEFDIDVLRLPFTMSYPLGPRRYSILGCKYTKIDMTNEQATGNTEWSVSFLYTQKVKTK